MLKEVLQQLKKKYQTSTTQTHNNARKDNYCYPCEKVPCEIATRKPLKMFLPDVLYYTQRFPLHTDF